jgi:RNA polymerase sigma-70 factor (ECF subfamily)
MSGDSLSLSLPLSRFATDTREATTLYQELRQPLLRYLSGLGLPLDEAQDVVQDSFLALHKHLAANGSQSNIRSWVFRVAHNHARNHQQSYAQRMREPIDTAVETVSTAETPEQIALANEQAQRLDRAVRSLAAQDRECLMLRAEGLRYREIGEVLGIPTSTVADVVDRAIKKLAEKCHV